MTQESTLQVQTYGFDFLTPEYRAMYEKYLHQYDDKRFGKGGTRSHCHWGPGNTLVVVAGYDKIGSGNANIDIGRYLSRAFRAVFNGRKDIPDAFPLSGRMTKEKQSRPEEYYEVLPVVEAARWPSNGPYVIHRRTPLVAPDVVAAIQPDDL